MFFSDLYRSPKVTFAKFRHVQTPAPDYGDPDLVSKDKIKQKAAVRKFLDTKIRCDWEFTWPPLASASVPPVSPEVAASLGAASSVSATLENSGCRTPATEAAPGDPSTTTPPSRPSDEVAAPVGPQHAAPDDAPQATGLEPKEAVQILGLDDATTAPTPVERHAAAGVDGNDIDDGNESDDDTASIYSAFSEDEANFRPRLEWESELSDEEPDHGDSRKSASYFRFESPDTVGETIQADALSKKEKRRRAARDEAVWNEGLACFEARRNAWTGAKTVRLKKQPPAPVSGLASLSPRRLFFRSTPPTTPLSTSPNDGRRSGDSPLTFSDGSDPPHTCAGPPLTKKRTKSSSLSARAAAPLPIETLIPIAPPLLPPSNVMRSSITPSVYPALYDKLVVNSLMPSCPVNLSDMIRSCVVGWKRDGEWPPRAAVDPYAGRRKKKKKVENGPPRQRRLSKGILGKEKEGEGGGIRRGMQKLFGQGSGQAA